MFFMYLRSIGIFLNEQQVLEILFTRSKDTLSDNLNILRRNKALVNISKKASAYYSKKQGYSKTNALDQREKN
jgi:hypothetical protein